MRAPCPVCGGEFTVTSTGQLRAHVAPSVPAGYRRTVLNCSGGAKPALPAPMAALLTFLDSGHDDGALDLAGRCLR